MGPKKGCEKKREQITVSLVLSNMMNLYFLKNFG